MGIPRRLEEVAQYGLSTRAHMALVTIGTIYIDLNIGSIRGKPIDTDPLLYKKIHQHAIEPSEAIIHDVDLSVIVQGSMPDSSEDSGSA
jgi:methyl coenzyme M reductase subunit C